MGTLTALALIEIFGGSISRYAITRSRLPNTLAKSR